MDISGNAKASRRLTLTLTSVVFLLLVACGGGGGSSATSTPDPVSYTVDANVSGLTGSGLTLQLNGGNALAVTADGAAMFSTALASGAQYAVTVSAQPTTPAQTCTMANASGTIGSADIANVNVTCVTPPYTINVNVTGLTTSGLVLQLNGADDLAITLNGTATFSAPLATGENYAVTVSAQPSGQTCTVANGTGTVGTVGTANVTNVNVTCNDTVATGTYTVTVNLTGLTGSTLVLQLNSGAQLAITSNGVATFSTQLPTGASYAVTVLRQPIAPPPQTCTISNGAGTIGTINVTDVAVTCVESAATPIFDPVGGTYPTAQSVVISTTMPSSSIYYTTDGSTPSVTSLGSSTLYTAPVAVGVSKTLNALAVRGTTILQQPTVTGIAGNLFVQGASGAGSGDPPNSTFALVSDQASPLTGDGLFQVNTWDPSALTGFKVNNPSGSQLAYAATGTNPITIAQYEGNTVGVYLQATDLPSGTDQMIAAQTFYARLNLFTSSSVVLSESMMLQVPTSSGATPFISVKHYFAGPGGANFDISVLLFHNGATNAPAPTITYDANSNAYVHEMALGAASSAPYLTSITGAYTGTPYTGFKPLAWSISQAQVIATLQALQAAYPAIYTTTDPTQYQITNIHVNAEIRGLPNSDTLGWSMQNWVSSLLQSPSAVGSAAYAIR